MSAAATAAGYLYASGRLRGRNGRENGSHQDSHPEDRQPEDRQPESKRQVRVAVYQPNPEAAAPVAKKTPKIVYRTRRWRPE